MDFLQHLTILKILFFANGHFVRERDCVKERKRETQSEKQTVLGKSVFTTRQSKTRENAYEGEREIERESAVLSDKATITEKGCVCVCVRQIRIVSFSAMCVYQRERERERERYNVLRCVRECTPRYVMDEPDEVSLKKISFNCHSLSKYEMLNKG